MGAVWTWVRSDLRRRRRGNRALVLLIGLSGAVVLTAAAGARRTDTAFARALESSRTADIQVQYLPADDDDEVLKALRNHPDVEVAAPVYLTVVFSDRSDYDLLILSGPDPSLFQDVDRPRLLSGRVPDPSAADEVLLTPPMRDALGAGVGDIVSLGTFSAEQFRDEDFDEPAGPVLELRVVGIGTLPYDVVDPTFFAALTTPAFHAARWGDVGGFGPLLEIRTSGARDPSAIAEEAIAGFDFDELFLTPSSDLALKVEDGTRVLVTGVQASLAVAGLAFVVVGSQALRRRMDVAGDDQAALQAIGFSRTQRAVAAVLTIAPSIAGGALLAALLAIPASATMPIGVARTAEPHPGIDVDAWILILGALSVAAVLMLTAAWSAVQVVRRRLDPAATASSRRARSGLLRAVRARLRPPEHLGLAMAVDPGAGRGTVPVRSALIGAGLGVAGVAAVLTFGASLDRLTREPARSGWNWTLAPEIEDQAGLDQLAAVPGVVDLGRIVHRQVVVEGDPVTGIALATEVGRPSLTVLRGRMPLGPNEIAVGPELEDRTSSSIGDVLVVDTSDGHTREMAVVGVVLFPTFDDDSAFNDGVAMSPEALEAIGQSDGFEQVVVRFDGSVSVDEASRRTEAALPGSLSVYSYPSLPPDVANLEAVRFLPRLLGAFLGILALAAVWHAVATNVQRRRRELGTVRALGFVAADVRRSVAAQSTTLVLLGLAVGLPVGLILGRTTWRLVAEGIGVSGAAAIPLLALAAVVPATLLAGIGIAWLPGRAAARRGAGEALHTE